MKIMLFIVVVNQLVLGQITKVSPLDERKTDSLLLSAEGGSSSSQLVLPVSIIITAGFLVTDQKSYDALNAWREHNAVVRTGSTAVTELGNGLTSMVLFGGFWVYGELADDNRAKRVGILGAETFFLTGIAVQLVKQLSGRERPTSATEAGGAFHGPFRFFTERRSDHKSWTHFDAFPSGHTASAFATATILADHYPTSAVRIVAYGLATAVGISRVTEQTHWLSDVFIGAVFGYYGAKLVEQWNEYGRAVTLIPQVSSRGNSILLTINF